MLAMNPVQRSRVCPAGPLNKGQGQVLLPGILYRRGSSQLLTASVMAPLQPRTIRNLSCLASASAVSEPESPARPVPPAPLRVVIAGAGIAGLALAAGLLNKGYEVVVLERDLTAIRGEGKYRGPIQVRPPYHVPTCGSAVELANCQSVYPAARQLRL